MRIRTKTSFLIGGLLLVLAAILLVIAGSILFSTASANDHKVGRGRAERAHKALLNEITLLDRTTVDYASWDETYAFVQNRNPDFIRANFVDDTYAKNRFGFVTITDTNDAPVFLQAFDLEAGQVIPFPESLRNAMFSSPMLLQHDHPDGSLHGLLSTGDGLYLIASRPILTGHYEGPIRGSMIIGRPFNLPEVKRLAELTLFPAMMIDPSHPEVPREILAESGGTPNVLTRLQGPDMVVGYRLIRDISGQPAGVLKVTANRDFHRQAIDSFLVFAFLLAVVVLVAMGISLTLLDRLLISRITCLHDLMQSMSDTRDFNGRLALAGHDELAQLGVAFNNLLNRMQEAISHRQVAETALTESERVFYTLLSNLHGMAYRCSSDPDWTMRFVSEGSRELTGYEPADLIGNPSVSFNRLIHPDDRAMANNNIQAAVQQQQPYQLRYRIRDKAGQEKWVFDQGRGIFAPDGTLLFLEGFLSDITRQSAIEAEHRKLENQILQGQKLESLGLLAGGIAHDFNNFLMVVLGNADLTLLELPSTSPARAAVLDIIHSARQAADLCRQLLAYSGKGKFLVQPLDLSRTVHEMVQMLAVSISKKVQISYHLDDHLPAVEADPSQVHQIIMNLIINASDAVGDRDGTIEVSTGHRFFNSRELDDGYPHSSGQAPGPYVYIQVTDSGCGMDPATMARIFDPFFTTKFTGRGLGLAAVLGIVRGHNGHIKINSRPGHGTTFHVLFPASAKPLATSTAISDPDPWTGHGTILVVDDEANVRIALERMLHRLGFSVCTAGDGLEAIRVFSKNTHAFVALVLDLTMPQMDGEETYRELLKIRPDIPVLIASGYDADEISMRFPTHCSIGFIQKPFTSESLKQALRRLLKNIP